MQPLVTMTQNCGFIIEEASLFLALALGQITTLLKPQNAMLYATTTQLYVFGRCVHPIFDVCAPLSLTKSTV